MLIPTLCASAKHLENIPKGLPINFYIGNGTLEFDIEETLNNLKKVEKYNKAINMVHLLIPEYPADYYRMNKPYFDFIRSLGAVGITLHYMIPHNHLEENILFSEIVRIHNELPDTTLYIENTHSDIYGLFNMVRTLNDIDIKTYMLIDTCHLEMDSTGWTGIPEQDIDLSKFFRTYKKYIGAVHISASQKEDGFSHNKHGKPIRSNKDYDFYSYICWALVHTNFDHDVIVIPEIIENTYDETCTRENGLKAHNILKDIINQMNEVLR